MAYQVTLSMNPAFTGTTEADNFTIIGKHCDGSPSDTIIATNVTKAQLIAGVTYQVADTVTGGTVTSTGTCTNSVLWTGLSNCQPGEGVGPQEPVATPVPTATSAETLYDYYITTFRVGDAQTIATEFCETPYSATTLIKSPASAITNIVNQPIYDAAGDPYIVAAGRWAYITKVQGRNSNNTIEAPKYMIESSLGIVDNLATVCDGAMV